MSGLEWIWEKNKFLDRKTLMSEYYADFKNNGQIDSEKFKTFDPFQESPDTPTQIGTAILYPKSIAYMMANIGDWSIMDLKGAPAGTVNVDLLPCDANGKPLSDKDAVVVNNPEKDLLNKKVNFMIKINNCRGLNERYEVRIR